MNLCFRFFAHVCGFFIHFILVITSDSVPENGPGDSILIEHSAAANRTDSSSSWSNLHARYVANAASPLPVLPERFAGVNGALENPRFEYTRISVLWVIIISSAPQEASFKAALSLFSSLVRIRASAASALKTDKRKIFCF